jgi:asparagine synthase (glutamine-hydrolysing)
MSGLVGVISRGDAIPLALRALERILHRGEDWFGLASEEGILKKKDFTKLKQEALELSSSLAILHCSSAEPQPVAKRNLIIGCDDDIYNKEEIETKLRLSTSSSAELILKLFSNLKSLKKTLFELDGGFAFSIWDGKELIIARDKVGIKPIWYGRNQEIFAFASERKALWEIGLEAKQLVPRDALFFDGKIRLIKQVNPFRFGEKIEEISIAKRVVKDVLFASCERIARVKPDLLFSGGLDSSLLALALPKAKAYVCGIEGAKDLKHARRVAREIGLDLREILITKREVEEAVEKVIYAIEESDPVKVSIAIHLFLLSSKLKEKAICSGLGADELFAGYESHAEALSKGYEEVKQEYIRRIENLWINDLYPSDCATALNHAQLRFPFLTREMIEIAIPLSSRLKIDKERRKIILREVAKEIGLPRIVYLEPKRAIQYGSGIFRILKKICREKGFERLRDYFLAIHNKFYK